MANQVVPKTTNSIIAEQKAEKPVTLKPLKESQAAILLRRRAEKENSAGPGKS